VINGDLSARFPTQRAIKSRVATTAQVWHGGIALRAKRSQREACLARDQCSTALPGVGQLRGSGATARWRPPPSPRRSGPTSKLNC